MLFNNIINSFNSLLNNNSNHNDLNLNQGKEFLNYEFSYKQSVIPHLKPLQLTTSPKLSSIIESLDNQTVVNNTMNQPQQTRINNIETEFNQKITEYSNTYKIFIENLINNTKDKNDIIKYYGKVVKDNENNYTYVNDYGYTHKYLSNSWESNDTSCPNTAEEINTNLLNKFLKGPNMGSGQACKIAGQNIKNIETNEIAWVDIKGFKHVYSQGAWNKKQNSCNIKPIELSARAYNNIPRDSPMEEDTECLKLNVDSLLWKKLQKLNDELIVLSKQLLIELDKLKTDDSKLNQQLIERQIKINEYIKRFEEGKINVDSINNEYDTVSGQLHHSSTYTKSSHYQYIIWFILAILIFIAILRTINGEDTTFISGILVIILVFILYYILKILY